VPCPRPVILDVVNIVDCKGEIFSVSTSHYHPFVAASSSSTSISSSASPPASASPSVQHTRPELDSSILESALTAFESSCHLRPCILSSSQPLTTPGLRSHCSSARPLLPPPSFPKGTSLALCLLDRRHDSCQTSWIKGSTPTTQCQRRFKAQGLPRLRPTWSSPAYDYLDTPPSNQKTDITTYPHHLATHPSTTSTTPKGDSANRDPSLPRSQHHQSSSSDSSTAVSF
jgi:hypothetical protein